MRTGDRVMRPFSIRVPEAAREDLRRRLARARWPRESPGTGWARGVPPDYLRELAEYWRTGLTLRLARRGDEDPNVW
jgi:epoxide hydrolase